QIPLPPSHLLSFPNESYRQSKSVCQFKIALTFISSTEPHQPSPPTLDLQDLKLQTPFYVTHFLYYFRVQLREGVKERVSFLAPGRAATRKEPILSLSKTLSPKFSRFSLEFQHLEP
ncbi:hypothetical protein VIGAN_09025900, partial [Vigna angularis var. angularis]